MTQLTLILEYNLFVENNNGSYGIFHQYIILMDRDMPNIAKFLYYLQCIINIVKIHNSSINININSNGISATKGVS